MDPINFNREHSEMQPPDLPPNPPPNHPSPPLTLVERYPGPPFQQPGPCGAPYYLDERELLQRHLAVVEDNLLRVRVTVFARRSANMGHRRYHEKYMAEKARVMKRLKKIERQMKSKEKKKAANRGPSVEKLEQVVQNEGEHKGPEDDERDTQEE